MQQVILIRYPMPPTALCWFIRFQIIWIV